MDVNKKLLRWFFKDTSSEEEIRDFLQVFSCFINTTNRDFFYNKTYLESYVEDLINAREAVRKKKLVLISIAYGIFCVRNKVVIPNLRVTLDDSIIFRNGKFMLKDGFSVSRLSSDKIVIEYYYNEMHEIVDIYINTLNDLNLEEKIVEKTKDFINSLFEKGTENE